jgi:hypothetical protein
MVKNMVTRRAVALSLTSAATVLAQTPTAAPVNADPLFAEQRARIVRNRDTLNNFKLPPSTEPIMRFEA